MSTGGISRTMRGLLARIAGMTFGGDRDLYQEFGYPADISPEHYRAMYCRGDLMARIVDAFPEATWREPPAVRPVGAKPGAEKSQLEKDVEALNKSVDLWGTMQRLDRLMGLGHYGVLMLGLDGGEGTDRPVQGGSYRLMYLTPHGETSAQITIWDSRPASPRFGLPQQYRLTAGANWTGVGAAQRALAVDWSRCIHVAERALEDKSIGQPRLERVWNRALDLDKLLGGSAEIYWQNAAQIRVWIADKDAVLTDPDKAQMRAQLDELQHHLRRDLTMQGVTPHQLTADAQSSNAGVIIERELEFISGATGIPKRILIGSERGELSSEQDENNWTARIMERREQFVTPYMIRPLIDRLLLLGVLRHAGEYEVHWPESDTLGEEKRSQIAKNKAEATATYVSTPGTDAVVAPEEFRKWLGEEPVSEYELAPMPELVEEPIDGAPGEGGGATPADPEGVAAFNRRLVLIENAAPRTLYVRRQVLNWREIAAWAKGQGFRTTLGAAMHVTLAFSKAPVDWMKISQEWAQKPGDLSGNLEIAAGGPRVVEPLGDKGAIVLHFRCNELEWRHEAIKAAGATWDYEGYQPHITLTYDPGKVDAAKVKPYAGQIILGPELFEEVDETWVDKVKETTVAA